MLRCSERFPSRVKMCTSRLAFSYKSTISPSVESPVHRKKKYHTISLKVVDSLLHASPSRNLSPVQKLASINCERIH